MWSQIVNQSENGYGQRGYCCPLTLITCVRVDTLDTLIMLTLRRAEGREFDPWPGQYSRMSFSSEQVTGTVFPHLNMPFLPNSEFIENIVLVGKH